jgi:hypothetical protein
MPRFLTLCGPLWRYILTVYIAMAWRNLDAILVHLAPTTRARPSAPHGLALIFGSADYGHSVSTPRTLHGGRIDSKISLAGPEDQQCDDNDDADDHPNKKVEKDGFHRPRNNLSAERIGKATGIVRRNIGARKTKKGGSGHV